jgi:hypothetical protein
LGIRIAKRRSLEQVGIFLGIYIIFKNQTLKKLIFNRAYI